jgi:ribonuclease BN (tRNA processing enzyme)
MGLAADCRGTREQKRSPHLSCEAALDVNQAHGVGTLLLAHLSRTAEGSGITEFEADVMGDNRHMLDVIRGSGSRVQQTRASGVVRLVWQIENVETLSDRTN